MPAPMEISPAVRDALASGRIDPRPVLDAPVGLEGLPTALRRMVSRELRGKVPVIPA